MLATARRLQPRPRASGGSHPRMGPPQPIHVGQQRAEQVQLEGGGPWIRAGTPLPETSPKTVVKARGNRIPLLSSSEAPRLAAPHRDVVQPRQLALQPGPAAEMLEKEESIAGPVVQRV